MWNFVSTIEKSIEQRPIIAETLRHQEIDPVLFMKGSFSGVFLWLSSVQQLEV